MTDVATIRAFLEKPHHDLAAEVASFAADSLRPLPPPEDDDAARRQAR